MLVAAGFHCLLERESIVCLIGTLDIYQCASSSDGIDSRRSVMAEFLEFQGGFGSRSLGHLHIICHFHGSMFFQIFLGHFQSFFFAERGVAQPRFSSTFQFAMLVGFPN